MLNFLFSPLIFHKSTTPKLRFTGNATSVIKLQLFSFKAVMGFSCDCPSRIADAINIAMLMFIV